jgi:hypothetical protein
MEWFLLNKILKVKYCVKKKVNYVL